MPKTKHYVGFDWPSAKDFRNAANFIDACGQVKVAIESEVMDGDTLYMTAQGTMEQLMQVNNILAEKGQGVNEILDDNGNYIEED